MLETMERMVYVEVVVEVEVQMDQMMYATEVEPSHTYDDDGDDDQVGKNEVKQQQQPQQGYKVEMVEVVVDKIVLDVDDMVKEDELVDELLEMEYVDEVGT